MAAVPSNDPRRWPSEGETAVPAWIYTDPDLLERELQRFHYGPTWSFVGLECELPAPQTWKRSAIGRRSVVATRDKAGRIHVVENRCAHRGAPLCWEHAGRAPGLTCPYHQWRYDLAGNLLGVPFEQGVEGRGGMPADFAKAEHGLTQLRVALRGGAIWASFDPQAPDFDRFAGERIVTALDRLADLGPMRLLGVSRQVYRANWKTWVENARDSYHATLLHTFFTAFGLVRADQSAGELVAYDGHTVTTTRMRPVAPAQPPSETISREMATFKADYRLHDMETVSTPRFDHQDGVAMGFQLFPGSMYQPHLNVPSFRQIIPRAVDEHEVIWTFFGFEDDDEATTRRRLKQANLLGPAGFVTAEDGEVIVKMQSALSANEETLQPLKLGLGSEAGTIITEHRLRDFYAHYREAMGL